ncbi:MAG: hypothetical protein GC168_00880 [Candidatus Hydrogenedens sp.]|nr:hypothetical protein [Candidatus Hydrogenedens sp.]
MSRAIRWIFVAVSLLLWVAVGLAAFEFYERWQEGFRAQAAVAAVQQARIAQQPELDAIATEFAGAPPETGADFQAREGFVARDEPAREDYADTRGEAVFLLDSNATVIRAYVPSEPGSVAAFAAPIGTGTQVDAQLDAETAPDFRSAVQLVRDGVGTQLRDYPVQLPGGGEEVLQFAFEPLEQEGTPVIGVFVRLSTWQKLWVDFRPNVHQDDAYDFQTNAQGWRDDPVVLPKPEGLYRIVCIGGSTTAEGPTNALTYPNMLENLLAERWGEGRVEVINAGVYASNAGVEAGRLQQYLALEPDLVIHYNIVNDLTLILPDGLEQGRAGWQRGLAASHTVYNHWNTLLLPSDAYLEQGLRDTVFPSFDVLTQGFRDAGVQFAFASFGAPGYSELDATQQAYFDHVINTMQWGRVMNMASYVHVVGIYNGMLEQYCREQNLLFLPVAGEIAGGAELYTDICHMNLFGMKRKAEAFRDALEPVLQEALQP